MERHRAVCQLTEQTEAISDRQVRHGFELVAKSETGRAKQSGKGGFSWQPMPRYMQSQQVVEQPFELLDVVFGTRSGFAEIATAPNANLLWHKPVLPGRGNTTSAGGAYIAQLAAMPETGHPRGQSPAAPEIGCMIFPQAGRTILQASDLRPGRLARPTATGG